MTNATRLNGKAMIAAVCIAACGWLPAQGQDASAGQRTPTSIEPDQPMLMVNKCSKLVGAKVKDRQGDTLGKIDDVIVDFNTGRVSYCAIKVKGSRFAQSKYLAVPLGALHPSVDGLYLILNADKEKIAQAKGFDQNNWPPMNYPAWGAQPFWQTPASGNGLQDRQPYVSPAPGPDLSPSQTTPPTTSPSPPPPNRKDASGLPDSIR